MYAFLAIVAHYVNVNGELGMLHPSPQSPVLTNFIEELLIDF